jgi:hypothetical protein
LRSGGAQSPKESRGENEKQGSILTESEGRS